MKNLDNINLDTLNHDELVELNRRVVDRIKMKRSLKSAEKARSIQVGDKVQFKSKKGGVIKGVVTKVNRKTIDIREDDNSFRNWRVTASLVEKR